MSPRQVIKVDPFSLSVSVCMATYNGERYLLEQIDSILSELREFDELVIVDDCSVDRTFDIVKNLSDSRVRVFRNAVNRGHLASFQKSIVMAKNEVIMLSDQDDIWPEGRLEKMLSFFTSDQVGLVTGKFSSFCGSISQSSDSRLSSICSEDSNRYVKNIINVFLGNVDYYGCCMAMTNRFAKTYLPFPRFIESHDIYYGMVANIKGLNVHSDDVVVFRRIHSNNVTQYDRPLYLRIKSRIVFSLILCVSFFTFKRRRHV